jgi:hypothetical protein
MVDIGFLFGTLSHCVYIVVLLLTHTLLVKLENRKIMYSGKTS